MIYNIIDNMIYNKIKKTNKLKILFVFIDLYNYILSNYKNIIYYYGIYDSYFYLIRVVFI